MYATISEYMEAKRLKVIADRANEKKPIAQFIDNKEVIKKLKIIKN
jgi:hypothetical protein